MLYLQPAALVVDAPAELLVARWDGTQWQDHGNGGTTLNSVLSGSAVTNFSPFILASTTENNPLPITLLSFEAKANIHEVVLKWSTLVELNNDYFTVERSSDSQNFKKVLEVPGGGTSDMRLHYSAIDKAPHYGTAYYRLKQTDFDGKSSYSPVVSVSLDNRKLITVYPTSFDTSFKIELLSNIEGTAKVKIINAVGASILYKEVALSGESRAIMIDTSTFPTDLYYIHLNENGTALTTKVLKK